MAHFHIDVSLIRKGKSGGSSRGFAAYIERRNPEQAMQAKRYLVREGRGKEDLVASGSGGLPQWANGPDHFWGMADQYERSGEQRQGLVAYHYQFTLPRELSPEGRGAVAEDIRAAFFARFPHTWALHNPPARDGGDNPHMHVMFSPRRDDDDRAVGPATWFSAKEEGATKDRTWYAKKALLGVRHETAILINAALEREGHALAVSPDRVRAQGHERSGLHYSARDTGEQRARIQTQQRELQEAGVVRSEQEWNVYAWEAQKKKEGIRDLSREAMVDFCRDRFWLHDRSPAREHERSESFDRAIEREWAGTGRDRDGGHEREVGAAERGSAPARTRPRLIPDEEWHPHGGAQVRLNEEPRWTWSR